MIITCEACNTSFNLDDKMLKPTGSKVRCSVCANVFTAFPSQAPPPEPIADLFEPENEPVEDASAEPAPVGAEDSTGGAIFAAMENNDTPGAGIGQMDTAEPPDQDVDLDFALDDAPEDQVADVEIEDAVSEILDEETVGIDFESETDSEAGSPMDAFDSAEDSDATIIASLEDDEHDADLSLVTGDASGASTVIADLDDDLDLSLDTMDEQSGMAETVIADLDQESLDQDILPDTDNGLGGTATIITDLDDDTMVETVSDLSDLDLSLDLEPEDAVPAAGETPVEAGTVDLDDISLDLDLETDAGAEENATEADADLGAIDDLDLSLDMDDGRVNEPDQALELEDDLDLSSLEGLLKDDESEGDAEAMAVDEGEEPELTFDMDDEVPAANVNKGDAAVDSQEDLAVDLDVGEKTEILNIDAAEDDGKEVDLSEIEKMLEEPETSGAGIGSVPEQDLDLNIEASLETEKWMSESDDSSQLVKDEELDLSELEQVLEDVDLDAADDTLEEPELELDLNEAGSGTPVPPAAADKELDFDLSAFEEDVAAVPGKAADSRESGDMELEFEEEAQGRTEETPEDDGLEATVAIPDPTAEESEAAVAKPAKPAEAKPISEPAKKGLNKLLIFLIIIVILGGGGYGTYYLLKQNGIAIPFIDDYLKPAVNDPGNLKLTTYDISSKFVDNANIGRLFVISGKVRNGYAEKRGMITIVGNIFSTNNVPVQQEKVYGGNVMSELELANLEWDKISSRLANRLGDNRSNVKIEPGKSIPFMVVFANLPDDLEEFTIEVTGSTKLK